MTLAEMAENYLELEIQKLATFLMKNFPGQLTGDKSPVDLAIEIMERSKEE